MQIEENFTPMMRQYHDIKRRHPGMLLFFRMGDFYEMFFEDAVEASRELEITLTARNNDSSGAPIPMCGVPYHALNGYLSRLIRKGYKVAVCEQTENPRQAKGLVKREVTRVVTPGTAVEEGLLESRENNFLAALLQQEEHLGAAFLDVSTGEFWVLSASGENARSLVQQELYHFAPSEVVLPEESGKVLAQELRRDLGSSLVCTFQPDWQFNRDFASRVLLEHFRVSALEGFGLNGRTAAVGAGGALLNYVRHTCRTALNHITGIRLLDQVDYLRMDESTIQNLELVRGLDGNKEWTLLAILDRTRTSMGGRLLRKRLLRPSLDMGEIDQRLDAVEELVGSMVRTGRLGRVLESIQDVERLVARVTLETANARDLLALRDSLSKLPELARGLEGTRSPLLKPHDDLLQDITTLLAASIEEKAPINLNDGGLIRLGYHPQLDDLRSVASSGKEFIARLEARERERTGIGNLKVRYNRVFGYFIEITNSNLGAVPSDYVRKQTLVNSERFITPELKEYEEKVLDAEERILELEKSLFLEIRSQVACQSPRIQQAGQFIARIDVLVSLAECALQHRYTRPRLENSQCLEIRGGRHPVVERHGSEEFVPNDLYCDTQGDQLLILTGPNMGGKSTYLRQNALIVVMAQMGSFVPAESARIGLVDRIFTRVGASDNLARGRSTFMVEMIETAHILNTATPRSLVLLDEVGRGTATFDGLSIAWSVAEFLCTCPQRRARTLFATHYLELTRLAELHDGVRNYCVAVRDSGQDILFFHRVMGGVANKSYGIEVARLAGLPVEVVARAREILSRLERKQLNLSGPSSSEASQRALDELQKTLW